jgi:hypothetical protein
VSLRNSKEMDHEIKRTMEMKTINKLKGCDFALNRLTILPHTRKIPNRFYVSRPSILNGGGVFCLARDACIAI